MLNLTLQDLTMRDQMLWVENAIPDNDNDGPKVQDLTMTEYLKAFGRHITTPFAFQNSSTIWQ